MAAASSRSRRRWRSAGCKTFFVADLAEARRVRARRAGSRDLRAQRLAARRRAGLRRALCAPGDRQPRSNSPNGTPSSRPAAGDGGAALHVDTGMNRLGLTVDEAAAIAPRIARREPRHHAGDEPSRLRRPAGASAQRPADPAVPRNPRAVPRHSRPRSPIRPAFSSARRRIATWCGRASRSTASIRRPASPIRCSRWST